MSLIFYRQPFCKSQRPVRLLFWMLFFHMGSLWRLSLPSCVTPSPSDAVKKIVGRPPVSASEAAEIESASESASESAEIEDVFGACFDFLVDFASYACFEIDSVACVEVLFVSSGTRMQRSVRQARSHQRKDHPCLTKGYFEHAAIHHISNQSVC